MLSFPRKYDNWGVNCHNRGAKIHFGRKECLPGGVPRAAGCMLGSWEWCREREAAVGRIRTPASSQERTRHDDVSNGSQCTGLQTRHSMLAGTPQCVTAGTHLFVVQAQTPHGGVVPIQRLLVLPPERQEQLDTSLRQLAGPNVLALFIHICMYVHHT
jgi:hypothetical protein